MRFLAIAAVVAALALTACDEVSELQVAPAGGGSISNPAPRQQPLAPGVQRMLEDPENFDDRSVSIYGESQAAAERKCEQQAENIGAARCLGCRQNTFSKAPYRFTCTIRSDR